MDVYFAREGRGRCEKRCHHEFVNEVVEVIGGRRWETFDDVDVLVHVEDVVVVRM
jgi:hypothetical protein